MARTKWDTAFVAAKDNAIFPRDTVNFPAEDTVVVFAEDIVYGETAIFLVLDTALVEHKH